MNKSRSDAGVFTIIICIICIVCTVHIKAQDRQSKIIDYGQRGNLFNIEEESLINVIEKRLRLAKTEGRLDDLQDKFIKKSIESIKNPSAAKEFARATKYRKYMFDPSYTQHTDILDHRGVVIVPAGSKVNPLDYYDWGEPLLFIDAKDTQQVKWASSIAGRIILTRGSPLEIEKMLGIEVYFDQGGVLTRRFDICYLPARISQEGSYLKVEEIKI